MRINVLLHNVVSILLLNALCKGHMLTLCDTKANGTQYLPVYFHHSTTQPMCGYIYTLSLSKAMSMLLDS